MQHTLALFNSRLRRQLTAGSNGATKIEVSPQINSVLQLGSHSSGSSTPATTALLNNRLRKQLVVNSKGSAGAEVSSQKNSLFLPGSPSSLGLEGYSNDGRSTNWVDSGVQRDSSIPFVTYIRRDEDSNGSLIGRRRVTVADQCPEGFQLVAEASGDYSEFICRAVE